MMMDTHHEKNGFTLNVNPFSVATPVLSARCVPVISVAD
jgi:hypothetical protein